MPTVARSRETLTTTETSGCPTSTMGRAPRRAQILSTMASFARTATNCVFLSWAFVPCASTATVAPAGTWSSHGSSAMPWYSESESAAPMRSSTSTTREARRDHRQARYASSSAEPKPTWPLSARTCLAPREASSSARRGSKPLGHVAKNSRAPAAPSVEMRDSVMRDTFRPWSEVLEMVCVPGVAAGVKRSHQQLDTRLARWSVPRARSRPRRDRRPSLRTRLSLVRKRGRGYGYHLLRNV